MLMLAIYKGDPDQRQPRHPALDVRALHQSYLQDSPNPSGLVREISGVNAPRPNKVWVVPWRCRRRASSEHLAGPPSSAESKFKRSMRDRDDELAS